MLDTILKLAVGLLGFTPAFFAILFMKLPLFSEPSSLRGVMISFLSVLFLSSLGQGALVLMMQQQFAQHFPSADFDRFNKLTALMGLVGIIFLIVVTVVTLRESRKANKARLGNPH